MLQDVDEPEDKDVAGAVLRRNKDSIWRLAGDRYVFIEFGDMVLDFVTRAKVAELEKWLKEHAPDGFIESNPGVRSALLEYDPIVLPLQQMLQILERYASPVVLGESIHCVLHATSYQSPSCCLHADTAPLMVWHS